MTITEKNIVVKAWFAKKEFSQSERYAMETSDALIDRETEKAYLLKWNTKFGVIKKWVPKSCVTMTEIERTANEVEMVAALKAQGMNVEDALDIVYGKVTA